MAAELRLLGLVVIASIAIALIAWAATTCGSTVRAPEQGASTGPPPTFTPEASSIPDSLTVTYAAPGSTINVWVYADTSTQPASTCSSLVRDLVPASATARFAGKATECTADDSSAFRFRWLKDGAGVLHLNRVEELLFGTARLLTVTSVPRGFVLTPGPLLTGTPSPHGSPVPRFCRDILADILPASADASHPGSITVCDVEPPARGQAVDKIWVWGAMPQSVPRERVPENASCWELSALLGGPRGELSYPVRCSVF